MDQPAKAWVIGAVNPLGRGASLLVPVLSDRPGGNAQYLQVSDADGRVSGFRPTRVDTLDRSLRDDARAVAVGDAALWGVTFPAGDSVVGAPAELGDLLRDRRHEFEDQTLALLGMARILWRRDDVLEVLRNAWYRLQALNPSGALTWRRTVAVPGAVRAVVETELRRRGITPARRDLAQIEFKAGDAPAVTLPDALFHMLDEHDAMDAVGDEARAVGRAVGLPDLLVRISVAPVRLRGATASGGVFPATIWGVGPRGAELVLRMTPPHAQPLSDDQDPERESRFDHPAFPASIANVQVIAYPDAKRLRSRVAGNLEGKIAEPDAPQERYGLIVFGPGEAEADAARHLAWYLRTEGLPAVGVLLEPGDAFPGNYHWLGETSAEPFPRDPSLLFLAPDLDGVPGGAATTLERLVLLLRAVGPPSQTLEVLSPRGRADHARIASVDLRPGEAADAAVGRCLARLRHADSSWASANRVIGVVETTDDGTGSGPDFAADVAMALETRAGLDEPFLFIARNAGPRLTLAVPDLLSLPSSPDAFEALCRQIFEDLGCQVAADVGGDADFTVGAPGAVLLVDARQFQPSVPAVVSRVVSLALHRAPRRLMLTAGIQVDRGRSSAADGVDVVDYRDIDRIEEILREEHAKSVQMLRDDRLDAPSELLKTYERHVIQGCAEQMADADLARAEVIFEDILWELDQPVGQVQARLRYPTAMGDDDEPQTLIVSFVISPEGPGPVRIHAALRPPASS